MDTPAIVERKRSRDAEGAKLTPVSKKAKPSAEAIVTVTDSDKLNLMEVNIEDLMITYSPKPTYQKMKFGVIAIGVLNVWRIVNSDFSSSDDHVLQEIIDHNMPDMSQFQPEVADFFVSEIRKGTNTLLQLKEENGLIEYETRHKGFLVHSSRMQRLNKSISNLAKMFVLSPNHGIVTYMWEQRIVDTDECIEWRDLCLPTDTCILYANKSFPGVYRCTVDDQIVTFDVVVEDDDDSCVTMNDIEFDVVIGRGSFGDVYKGLWKGTTVALKRIRFPPECTEQSVLYANEIAVLKDIRHPNIVRLFGYCLNEEDVVLIMNYVDGSNLDKLLFSAKSVFNSKVNDQAQFFIAYNIAKAVDYLHSHRPVIVHQDLKPQNVLVSTDLKQVCVCDMGLSKIKHLIEATCTVKGAGTFPYMAPEMFKKDKQGVPADIYSFGCLLIELFGRKRVWAGLHGPEILLKVLGSYETCPESPSTSHLPERFQSICSEMTSLDYGERPTSTEVIELLENIH